MRIKEVQATVNSAKKLQVRGVESLRRTPQQNESYRLRHLRQHLRHKIIGIGINKQMHARC